MESENSQQRTENTAGMKIHSAVRGMANGNRTAGIVIAICMVVIGILIFVAPLIMGLGIAYLVTIGFIVYGIFAIVAYVRTPSDYRNGWTLANGIIFTLLGVLILAEALGGQFGKINMISTFSFIIGFFALFGGITQISSYGAFKKEGTPGAGWILASGIINLILGIIVICAPIAGWFAMEWIFAIYLIIGGVALFAEACSGRLACRK